MGVNKTRQKAADRYALFTVSFRAKLNCHRSFNFILTPALSLEILTEHARLKANKLAAGQILPISVSPTKSCA